jgi:DNA polymerase-1
VGATSTGSERRRVAIDIETEGLDPRKGRVVAVGFALEDGTSLVIESTHPEFEGLVRQEVSACYQEREVYMHNGVFDMVWLNWHFKVGYPKVPCWDTMLAERCLVAGLDRRVSLEETAQRYLKKYTKDKSQTTTFEYGVPLTPEQMEYLVNDVSVLIEVADKQAPLLTQQGLDDVWDIERHALPVFCEQIVRGIKVNRSILEPLIEREKANMDAINNKLIVNLTPHVQWLRMRKHDEMLEKRERHAANKQEAIDAIRRLYRMPEGALRGWKDEWNDQSPHGTLDGWTKGEKRFVDFYMKEWNAQNKIPPKPKLDESDINLGSDEQMKAAFASMGLTLDSVSAPSLRLALLKTTNPEIQEVIRDILTYRKSAKIVQAFGDNLLEALDENDRIHGWFKPYGTDTGRPSGQDPNLLTLPKKPVEYRESFEADEGMVLVDADMSQMELRLTAQASRDPEMMRAFRENLDLHTNTAALMFNLPYDAVPDDQRSVAKTINFMTLYGGGAGKLRSIMATQGIEMSQKDAEFAMRRWKEVYATAWAFLQQQGDLGWTQGYTCTAFGRRRRFEQRPDMERWMVNGLKRQAANHVIQGSCADIAKLAMGVIQPLLMEIGGSILLQIYDGILAEVPEEHAEYGAQVVYWGMRVACEEVLRDVPAVIDCHVGRTWKKTDALFKLS